MSNIIHFQTSVTSVPINNKLYRVKFLQCDPLARLVPKGSMILLSSSKSCTFEPTFFMDLLAMGGYHVFAISISDIDQHEQPAVLVELIRSILPVALAVHIMLDVDSINIVESVVADQPKLLASVSIVPPRREARLLEDCKNATKNLFLPQTSLVSSKPGPVVQVISDDPEYEIESFVIRILSFANKHVDVSLGKTDSVIGRARL